MSITDIQITAAGVIESTIIYGIVHSFYMMFKWGAKHLGTEAGQIIDSHVKDGHHSRLEHCLEGNCARLGIALNSIRQVNQPKQPQG